VWSWLQPLPGYLCRLRGHRTYRTFYLL